MAEVSLIESGLYLGSFEAARDPELLQSLGISHVLVVASDLPYLHSFITYKNVTVDDMPDQDIESEFTGCIAFIGAALEAGGKVLVHCLSGISRSPTVVIAYLIASRHMRLDAALSLVTELHPATDPNMGFLRQLRRFESQVVISSQFQDPIQKYTCKRCRVALFTQLDLDPHTSIKVKTPHKGKGRKNYEPTKSFCSSLFVVHQPWMGEIQGNDGKLMCPKCAAKLGQYIYSGKQCSCGRFVSPAFQIHVSSVDEVPLTVALGHVSTPRFQELLEEQKQ